MAQLFTLDASVFVGSCHRHEPGHASAVKLLHALRIAGTPLIEPALLPVEVAAALSRTGTDPGLANDYACSLLALPRFTLVPVNEQLARQAAALAAWHHLRGADAVYAAVALLYGADLVTMDREQLQRTPPGLKACKPEAAVSRISV